MIELRAVGAAEILTDSAILTPSRGIVFATALYLVMERGKRVSRTRLGALIWPDIAHKSRAHRLRQTILQLKKLGIVVKADRDTVSLDTADVLRDADSFGSSFSQNAGVRSVDFLPGYNPAFSGPFREWVDSLRSEFQSSAVAMLVHQLEAARSHGDWKTVDKTAAKCLSLDAFNEEAVLAKAEAAAMRGSKRKAVSILDEYLSEIGDSSRELKLPATLLRRRVVERVPDRPSISNAEPAFVGREADMAKLTRAFEHMRAGKGATVLLIGEPGIGKTRLSAELARFAELRGARVQRAGCRRADIDRPLSLFVDIVPQLREMPGALGCAPETFSWLKRLTDFQQRSDDSGGAVDTDMLFENIRAALFDLLESISEEHCFLMVIEDLQWLDKASAKLLVQMGEWSQTRRILFVLNARPGPHAFLEYAEKVQLQKIELGPLAPKASTALLRSVALRPEDEPDAGFVDWCVSVAEGNPFFLQELAHQWIETGRRHEAPPSINKVLQERLSRLSAEGLQVLQACAVLNDYASVDRVEQLLQYHSHQLLSAVEELSKVAMLSIPAENAEMSGGHMQPRHDFLASAAISRLSPISLAFLHRRAADILETELAHNSASATLLWTCATHRHHAGDRGKALSLRISCAEHLLDLGLARDACTAFQRTMDYCANDSDRLRVTSRLARAFELDGEWKQSIEMLRACMSLASRMDASENEHSDYELAMLDARHHSALDFATLLEESLQCVNSESASPRHRVGAAVLALKLSVDFGRADYVEAIYAQVSQFLTSPEVSELGALQVQTIYRTMRGESPVPISDLEELIEVARRTDGELAYSQALLMAATACRLSARYEEGLQFASRALDHAVTYRFFAKRTEIMLSSAYLHISAGEYRKADALLSSIRGLPSSDSAKERNEVYSQVARVAVEEGDYARAASAFQQIDLIEPTYSASRTGYYIALEVRIRLMENADKEVIQQLVSRLEALHLQLREIGAQDFEAHTLFLGLCALNQRDRALRLLREYVVLRRIRWPLAEQLESVLSSAKDRQIVRSERARIIPA